MVKKVGWCQKENGSVGNVSRNLIQTTLAPICRLYRILTQRTRIKSFYNLDTTTVGLSVANSLLTTVGGLLSAMQVLPISISISNTYLEQCFVSISKNM